MLSRISNIARAPASKGLLLRSFSTAQIPSNPAERVRSLELTSADPDSDWKSGFNSTDEYFSDNQKRELNDPVRDFDPSGRVFSYAVQGTAAFVYASLARSAVTRLVGYWSASADVLAMASLEVDIGSIPEGNAATVKWRGKPVFIRHRTKHEIELAVKDDNESLRDQQTDVERHQKPEWAIVLGVCTHLGCVPINGAGDWHGWFCPCHGSHYDTSGRIRKGPAPLNLEVPQYKFITDTKVILG